MSHAYLFAYLTLTQLFLGALLMLLFQPLVSPKWLKTLLPAAIAAQRLALPLAIGFVPLALLAPNLYPWVNPGDRHFSPYLTMDGFWIRGVVYWAAWLFLSRLAKSGSGRASAPALVVVGFTASFAAIDWVLSLSPEFGSTAFGLIVFLSSLLIAFGFSAFLRAPNATKPERQDQGSIHLALVCMWTYVSFMQFLVVLAGNLPREAAWYSVRSAGGWVLFPIALTIFQFALPFVLLLLRPVKRSEKASRALAALSVLMQILFAAWQTLPEANGLLLATPAFFLGLALCFGGFCFAGRGAYVAGTE
jgi:hypothetical protein